MLKPSQLYLLSTRACGWQLSNNRQYHVSAYIQQQVRLLSKQY